MNPSGKLITVTEARNLREQLRPAFAGYVTDGNISNRDVLGTLMDLIVRGKIGLDADTQKTPVRINKVYRIINFGEALDFEVKFINKLFERSNELNMFEVQQKILSGELHQIIEENLLELKNNKIVGSQLIVTDKQGEAITLEFRDKADGGWFRPPKKE